MRRSRGVARWGWRGLGVLTLALGALWLASYARDVSAQRGPFGFNARDGRAMTVLSGIPWTMDGYQLTFPVGSAWWAGGKGVLPATSYMRLRSTAPAGDVWLLTFPLWYPFGLALISAGACLWLSRARRLLGHCASCGYDLARLNSRRCPECGAVLLRLLPLIRRVPRAAPDANRSPHPHPA
jgi:hypothetical protein